MPQHQQLDVLRRRGPAKQNRLREIYEVAGSTGNDPELDLALLRFHTETAARRGGALALRRCDLDPEQSLVRLFEKGGAVRWQPVSPSMMQHLLLLGAERGAVGNEQLLRYRNGDPITRRRYDYLWQRLGKHLPWVATQQVSTHWIRYTTLTWVERHFGYAVARAFAGHFGNSDAGTTTTYVRATVEEVATALAALTNEEHPLAVTSTQDICESAANPLGQTPPPDLRAHVAYSTDESCSPVQAAHGLAAIAAGGVLDAVEPVWNWGVTR